MGSAGRKRSTRVSGDTILRSGRRLNIRRYEEAAKRMRFTPFTGVDTQEDKIKLPNNEKQGRVIKLGEFKKVDRNGADDDMRIDHEDPREIKENGDRNVDQERNIKLGKPRKTGLVDDDQDRAKRFGVVYTRKRKRTISCDLNCPDKKFKNKYFKKRVRTNLGSVISNSNLGSYEKDVLRNGSVILFGPCSYKTTGSIYGFSSFVTSVLRYMRQVKAFSWTQFSSFLLSELTVNIYSSIGVRVSQDSNFTIGHGFLKLFRPVLSALLFTVDFIALPFCFLYIHSSLLLKFAFLSYALILHPVVDDIKVPSNFTGSHNFGRFLLPTKPRSSRRRVSRVLPFNKLQTDVDSTVPVPGVREVAGYEQENYVPFRLPEVYISSISDEVSRTLQKSYPIYDMDSGDEKWLNKVNNERFVGSECISEDTFERVIDAFERGIYCNPDDYNDATSAVNRCLGLASKEVLEAVHKYWMTKRKKKRSPLVRVFKCYRRTTRAKKHAKNTVPRKKRSPRRRKSQRHTGKQVDLLKGMMNEKRSSEEAAKAHMKVYETQEEVRRKEAAAIAKRHEAQDRMEAADLATYRATMALRIAEALAATNGSEPMLLCGMDCQ